MENVYNVFVGLLSEEIQKEIEKDLIAVLEAEGIAEEEIALAVEDALDSRLSNLAHVLDVEKYLHKVDSTVAGCLEVMQDNDRNGTFLKAIEEIALGDTTNKEVADYCISVLNDWIEEMSYDLDKRTERKIEAYADWIAKLELVK